MVLSHGPNFTIVTQEPPIGEYIAQAEKVCQNLKQGEAEELRGEKRIKGHQKKDQDRMMLTADKGVSMVVMDRDDYVKKSEELLSQST